MRFQLARPGPLTRPSGTLSRRKNVRPEIEFCSLLLPGPGGRDIPLEDAVEGGPEPTQGGVGDGGGGEVVALRGVVVEVVQFFEAVAIADIDLLLGDQRLHRPATGGGVREVIWDLGGD